MLSQVIHARFEEKLEMLKKEIIYSKIFDKGCRKIIISGGGSNLKGLIDEMITSLNCDVTFGKTIISSKRHRNSTFFLITWFV